MFQLIWKYGAAGKENQYFINLYIWYKEGDMEIKLNIGISQLISLIRQLPLEQRTKIKKEIEKGHVSDTEHKGDDNLTELLLEGPTMTKEEEQNFKSFNSDFDQWTKNLFA